MNFGLEEWIRLQDDFGVSKDMDIHSHSPTYFYPVPSPCSERHSSISKVHVKVEDALEPTQSAELVPFSTRAFEFMDPMSQNSKHNARTEVLVRTCSGQRRRLRRNGPRVEHHPDLHPLLLGTAQIHDVCHGV